MSCMRSSSVSPPVPPPPPSSSFSPFYHSLLGVWRGFGRGFYPSITSFDYVEQAEFKLLPNKPIIEYRQSTWVKINHSDDSDTSACGDSLHSEVGYIRFPLSSQHANNTQKVEMLIVQPSGIAEVLQGQAKKNDESENDSQKENDDRIVCSLVLDSKSVSCVESAKQPEARATRREFQLFKTSSSNNSNNMKLISKLWMSTSNQNQLAQHLECTMIKVS